MRSPLRSCLLVGTCASLLIFSKPASLAQVPAPELKIIGIRPDPNGTVITWEPFPAAQRYRMFTAPGLGQPFSLTFEGELVGNTFTFTNAPPLAIFRVEALPLSRDEVLTANILNRISYGPTPDVVERVLLGVNGSLPIGPDAYIAEQLAPETITDDFADLWSPIYNIASTFPAPTDWVQNGVHPELNDLTAWFLMRAIHSDKQLVEIMLQWCENHFVTQHNKTEIYLQRFYQNTLYDNFRNEIATAMELQEIQSWRQILENPNGTFFDLLDVSFESPAMIIYLDGVTSRGDRNGANNRIANENYARELLELFTFGVDNGYHQEDIVQVSRVCAGWTVEMVETNEHDMLFAERATTPIPGATGQYSGNQAVSELFGVFSTVFRADWHDNRTKRVFNGYTVDPRFGAPYTTTDFSKINDTPAGLGAGRYDIILPHVGAVENNDLNRNASSPVGTADEIAAMQQGIYLIKHLADLPYTQEYISVKLCRKFVHDDFQTGYDFSDGESTPEEDLIRACMAAWETPGPDSRKGNLRNILNAIFTSPLFQSHAATAQKVKDPMEFLVSSVRSLRTYLPSIGIFTADSNGYDLISPLNRLGNMLLFDRTDPDGYPEAGQGWISAGAIAERIRFVQSMMIRQGQSGHNGGQGGLGNDAGSNTYCDPTLLLNSKLAPLDRNDPGVLIDYLLERIYPGEGKANVEKYKKLALDFINTDDNGAPSMYRATSGTTREDRLRGVAALLMSLQRFQEQ